MALELHTKTGKVLSVENRGAEPAKGDAISESGNKIPAATYELVDGRIVYTDRESRISSIEAPPSPPPSPADPTTPAPEPKVLKAIIDPKQKPDEGPVPFNFSNPQTMHKEMGERTKGDAQEPEKKPEKKKVTLEQLDDEIARDEKKDKEHTIDDYTDTATMFIEGWESVLTLVSRWISKDTSDSAYEFSVQKKERLIHQATKVSRKRGWVIPVEYLFAGTLIPATAQIIVKATDRRKQYNLEQAAEKLTDKDTATTTTPETKSTRRGRGRPSK